MAKGPLETLNIGTGGGVETVELLKRGNRVTVIEIDEDIAKRTKNRANRNGYCNQCTVRNEHILDAEFDQQFDQIVMTEVLEHIEDDEAVIQKLADLLRPGGRLLLSTPTASSLLPKRVERVPPERHETVTFCMV